MCGGSESVGDQLDGGVDEETNKDARSEDFRIRTLLLVQVPCSTHAQEIAGISCSVEDDDHNVDDLERQGKGYVRDAI